MSKNVRNSNVGINVIIGNEGSGADNWSLMGNTGNSASFYLGTTDNTALLLATNNDLTKATKFKTDGSIEQLGGNIMIGNQSGLVKNGSNNICLTNLGILDLNGTESNCICIGTDTDQGIGFGGQSGITYIGSRNNTHRCFIHGIYGHGPPGSASPMYTNSYGDIGTLASSERYKNTIEPLLPRPD